MKPSANTVALAIRYEAVRELLAVLVNGDTNDREAGRRALLIAFILDRTLIGTQRQLARRMGVTEGRACQMLKSIRRNFPKQFTSPLTPR